MTPKAPDPNGPMPDGWNPRHWLAYVPWSQGEQHQAVADASGYSIGHVRTLSRTWQKTMDCSDLTLSPGGLTPDDIAKGQEVAAVTRRLSWTARQEGLADDLGDDIETIRVTVRAIVTTCLTPERLATMDPLDAARAAKDLVVTLERMAKMANQAAGLPDVNRTLSVTGARFGEHGPEDPSIEPDLLGDLLSVSGAPQDVLDAMEAIAQGYLTETSPGSLYDAVIEIEETEPA